MRVSPSQKLELSLLRTLGMPEEQVGRIRDELHQRDQLAVDGSGKVALGTLEAAATAAERVLAQTGARHVPLPAETLRSLLAPIAGDALEVQLDAPFPAAEVSGGAPVEHPDRLGEVVDPKVFGARAEKVTAFLERQAPELAQALQAGTATVGALGRALGTDAAEQRLGMDLELALADLGRVGGPAYTSKDIEVNLDSRFSHLEGSPKPGEIGVFQKRMVEDINVKRGPGPNDFLVNGFERDKVVVSVPKGATVLLLDAKGNQSGARMTPKPVRIGEDRHLAVTIDRGHVQHPDRQMFAQDPRFGVRVIDGAGEVLYERNLAFDKRGSNYSRRVFEGKLAAQPSPEPELAALWDHHVPDAKHNRAPVGERPRFEVGGEAGDRVRIRRDGETFDLARLVQLMTPPKHTKQVFKTGRGFIELQPPRGVAEIDAKDYDPTKTGKLRTSYGRGVTFDRKLSQTPQAHWGSRGIRVFDVGMRSLIGQFDPFTDAR